MNYKYIPDSNHRLRQILARKPRANLHEIRRAHPSLAAMSFDHLALRLDQIDRDQDSPFPG
ncbi:MAG: hypothetical protein KGL69_10200 [Alphaproteobacteria bacterium]|nr:hypothetical protein [Alphaproteobacteria bacterium]